MKFVALFALLSILIGLQGPVYASRRHSFPNRALSAHQRSFAPFGLRVGGASSFAERVQLSGNLPDDNVTVKLDSSMRKRSAPVPHFRASFLSILLYAVLLLRKRLPREMMAVVVVLYLVEVVTCSTRRYLTNSMSPKEFKEHLTRLMSQPPVVTWQLECYHYRRHSSRDDRIVTARRRQILPMQSWKDWTDTRLVEELVDTASNDLLKVTVPILVAFQDPASQARYEMEEGNFYNSAWDQHKEFKTSIHMDGHRAKIMVIRSGLSNLRFTGSLWFWIASLLGLTVPYRWYLSKHCSDSEVTITKSIQL